MLNYKNGVSIYIRTFLTLVLEACERICSYLCYFTDETEESFGEEDMGGEKGSALPDVIKIIIVLTVPRTETRSISP
jgi:hypothetical protein